MHLDEAEDNLKKWRLTAGGISVVVGFIILALKFYVYSLTHSTAILSDALESIVNVVAAIFALFAIRAAHEPPDDEHPYGHGKIEFVNAVFEGGLITFAAIMIAYEAIHALLDARPAPDLSNGLMLIVIAGCLNGLLGLFLLGVGKRTHSMALKADGKHVISDFYTSVGVILGLGLVKLTGLPWLDPAIAIVMAFVLGFTGIPLVKSAVNGLIDAADETLLSKICDSIERNRTEGIIRLHHVRAMRNGRRIHIDGHIVIPEFWTVEHAHDEVDEFQDRIVRGLFPEAEVDLHAHPCRRAYCSLCEVQNCPVRQKPFTGRPPLTVAELVRQVDITDRG
jgi:cation diffusion facilitator family transporter